MQREGMFYIKDGDLIVCKLCPHNCHLKDKQQGICSVRVASEGKLYTTNYGEISSAGLDPIEKKPLYHFHPGSFILSVGSFGCNFTCGFCQNYTIAKAAPKTQTVDPDELIALSEKSRKDGNIGLAFTYNEPSIWYEYVYDVSKKYKEMSRENAVVLVTNGYISEEALEEILPYVDAMNIDLKAFTNNYYHKTCGGDIKPVMRSIEIASKKCHVEVTTLLVNGYNDDNDEVAELSKWLGSVNRNIPLHLSRYYPNYKFTAPPTPEKTVFKSSDIAKQYLNYVYVGNIPGVDSNTYCPECNELLIDRGYYDAEALIHEPKCPKCGYDINIVL